MSEFRLADYRNALKDASREMSTARRHGEPYGPERLDAFRAIERAEHALYEARHMLTRGGRYEPLPEDEPMAVQT